MKLNNLRQLVKAITENTSKYSQVGSTYYAISNIGMSYKFSFYTTV
jgi:hypothetical protein